MYKTMKLFNFLSWDSLDFDFPQGVTLLEGFNYDDQSMEGCGKSSLINGLTWILYGKIPKDIKVNQVIREGQKKAVGTLILQTGHKIERERGRSTGSLKLTLPSGDLFVGKDVNATQDYIDILVGMQYETFLQSVYFAQNYGIRFITSDEKSRVKVLSDIVDLSIFDEADKKVGSLIKEEKDSLSSIQNSLEDSQMHLESQRALISQIEGYINQEFMEFESNKTRLENQKTALESELQKLKACEKSLILELREESRDSVKDTLKELEEGISTVQDDLKGEALAKKEKLNLENAAMSKGQVIASLNLQIKSLEVGVEALSKETSEIPTKFKELKASIEYEIESLTGKLKEVTSDICTVCGGIKVIKDEEEILRLTKPLKARLLELDSKNTSLIAKEVQELEGIQDKLKVNKKSQEELKELLILNNEELSDLEAQLAEFKLPDVTELKEALEIFTAEYEKASLKLSTIDSKISEMELNSVKIEFKSKELNGLKSDIERLNSTRNLKFEEDLKKAVSDNETLTGNAKALKRSLKHTKGVLSELKKLKDGFKETKSYTFKALLRDLTNKSNFYLAQLFEMGVKISFTNESEGGISKISDVVQVGDSIRPFALYSGGQSRRIQLAVDLALSDIVTERSDTPVNILILDEVCKDLSEKSMEKVLDLLSGLNKSVIIIEHNSLIKNIVSNTVEIELRDGVSRCL